MTFQEKFICILHTHLFEKFPTGLNNSLYPRQELLADVVEDRPIHVVQYLQDLGSEGGQSVVRVFIDLSLNLAPQEIIKRVANLGTGRLHSLRPVVHQVSFWSVLGVQKKGDILRAGKQLSVVLAVCLVIVF